MGDIWYNLLPQLIIQTIHSLEGFTNSTQCKNTNLSFLAVPLEINNTNEIYNLEK